MKKIYLITAALFTGLIAVAQAPAFVSVTPNSTTPNRLDKFELTVSLTGAFTNAYDYDDIALQSVFTAPSGKKDTVDGFYMQDYTLNTANGNLTATGSGIFKVRYTPVEAGNYSYVLSCTNTIGTTTQLAATFQSAAAAGKGFIRKNSSNYLGFDNGEQYIPIGENMAWQQSNQYTDYKAWTQKLSDNKGNFFRLWLAHWGFGLEWKNNYDNFQGLRKYKQTNAYYIDWLVNESRAKGLYIMFCINHHGQVSTTTDPNWGDSPYNAANGGPCATTLDFFSNISAKATLKNRLRYILARWGYSPNIESWELFNEVIWTNNYAANKPLIRDWHDEMATYLHTKDVSKHLVTTSIGSDLNDSIIWKLPSLDFTQSHFYSGSGNIESVLVGGVQSYLTAYTKPTVNGEFGINAPSGTTISTADPNGVNIHNSIWATTFAGAMGPGSPWYWNDYIDPQNLYYHFSPLSAVVANIPLKDASYKPATASVTSSITSNVVITPGYNYGLAPAGSFTINSDGTITPAANNLGQYLFGSVYNTQNRQPPTFTVNYPVAGQFVVNTGGSTGTTPNITIYVDGTQQLSQSAVVNTSYAVNISAGTHTIKVDNLGTDWILISNYTFTNIGSPINRYIIKSSDSLRVAGWLHNKNYNWLYLRNNGNTPPPPVNDASIQIPGVKNGGYTIALYSCSTGLQTGTVNAIASNNLLSFSFPAIPWDIAFTVTSNSILPIVLSSFTGQTIAHQNHLYVDISSALNVKSVTIERSNDAINFTEIIKASDNWNTIAGKHDVTDASPSNGENYYRLKITDKDGTVRWSAIVKLVNTKALFSVYPNPFTNYLTINADAGKYTIQIADIAGKTVSQKSFTSTASQTIRYPLSSLIKGTYYLVLRNDKNVIVYQEKLVKQ